MSENTNKKIVLIDGHSILNRAFFGLPDLTNSEGLHTNAIYGFLTIMFKILDEEKPDYLTVAFDVHAPTFRHKMYDAYKGTRKPMADELRQQVPVIKEVLCSMGIKTIECEGLEADDLLGTLSRRCEEEGMEVSVISGDRDLLQLATQHVKIRIPKTKQGRTEVEDYYAADVKERYQVTPKEFIDLKALMGDTADNIPGVPSIGEKTATKIITEYHPIKQLKDATLLEVLMVTGRSHQIRAHLASAGHPLAGDAKYGQETFNRRYKEKYQLKHQLLHAFRLSFPDEMKGRLLKLSGKCFQAPLPEQFERIIKEEKLGEKLL